MHFSTAVLASLLASALASPLSLEKRDIEVGYGQQIQNSDETNHWVWIKGESA